MRPDRARSLWRVGHGAPLSEPGEAGASKKNARAGCVGEGLAGRPGTENTPRERRSHHDQRIQSQSLSATRAFPGRA